MFCLHAASPNASIRIEYRKKREEMKNERWRALGEFGERNHAYIGTWREHRNERGGDADLKPTHGVKAVLQTRRSRLETGS